MYVLTKKGFEKLKAELEELERKLLDLMSKKQETAEQCGDLWHDNPTLYQLESEERSLRLKIREIRDKISSTRIIEEENEEGNVVKIGSHVKLEMENGEIKEFTILDPELSDPSKGVISYANPLGQAIMRVHVGDVVTYSVGQRKFRVRIISIGGRNKREKVAKNNFIVLEGLSGTGKTTIGKLLAKKIGAGFYKSPGPLFDSIRDKVDKEADLTARFFFYLAGVIQTSRDVSLILKFKPVVCDRYLLTTLCYHRAVGVMIDVPDSLFESLIKPTHTFLITCEKRKRLIRLYNRRLSYNDEQERKLQVEQKFLAEYRKYGLIELDNSSDDPSVAVEKILRFLRV